MTHFRDLLEQCGLNTREASKKLGVKVYSVRNWKYGNCKPNADAVRKLTNYAACAKKIFNKGDDDENN